MRKKWWKHNIYNNLECKSRNEPNQCGERLFTKESTRRPTEEMEEI